LGKIFLNNICDSGQYRSRFLKRLGLFLGSGFDLLAWAGSCAQKKPKPRKTPERSINAWAWTLGTGKSQALVRHRLDL